MGIFLIVSKFTKFLHVLYYFTKIGNPFYLICNIKEHVNFFDWVDSAMREHGRRVMQRLRDKEEALDAETRHRESYFNAEIVKYKNTMDMELAKYRMQLNFEKSKYALENNFRMAFACCLILSVLFLRMCGGSLRGRGYGTVGRMMLP